MDRWGFLIKVLLNDQSIEDEDDDEGGRVSPWQIKTDGLWT